MIGRESSRAQGLRSIITSSSRFFASSDNKIFLKVEGPKLVGFIKTGIRKLFYSNEIGRIIEMSPLCLLDFYVHESCQRSGFGKEIYEFMLRCENTTANKIAIDRPSMKSLTFMRKHYNLSDYIPQNNNFVVYRQYFDSEASEMKRRRPEEQRAALISTAQQALVNNSFQNVSNSEVSETVNDSNQSLEAYKRQTGNFKLRSRNDRAVTQEKSQDHHNSYTIDRTVFPKDTRRFEETKRNVAPIAPWATSAYYQAPSTTSSQYGIHTVKHK
jgi:alpha-tubulin N-acetyltransferase 1